ncbi:hypothetical protein WJX77_003224 [Trebouxia sp. C0004]
MAQAGFRHQVQLPLLVSHATLVAACGEAAQFFKPYQMVGVNFLMLLKRQSISGSILADEMGLGKTAQAICFLGVLKHVDQDSGPHLVVAPVSLLENWQRELRRWCPGLCLVTYYGKDRAQLRRQLLDARPSRSAVSAEPEVISVPDSDATSSDSEEGSKYSASNAESMEGVGQCHPEQPFSGRQEPPFNVMLTSYTLFERDSVEQQADRTFLKKWQWSHLLLDEAHALKNANAMRTKRLTSLSLQHCVYPAEANVDQLRCPMLQGHSPWNAELQNLLQFLLPDVFSKEEFSQSEDLQAVLGPFVLRRLKSEVASQLTAKQQHEQVVEMTQQQAHMYQKAVLHLRAKIGANGKGKGRKAESEGQAIVKQLGKQQAKGSQALIFSQWTSVLDILGWLLEMMGLTYVRLDGSTAVADRLSTVDWFNNPANGIFAFLVSTRAGGQGLAKLSQSMCIGWSQKTQ